jgi:transposase-like protein
MTTFAADPRELAAWTARNRRARAAYTEHVAEAAARHTRCTAAEKAAAVTHVGNGHSLVAAAAVLGVHADTVGAWVKQAERRRG